MTPRDLIAWQQARNLTGLEMAKLLGISRVTYSRWVHGRQRIARWVPYAIEAYSTAYLTKSSTAATRRKAQV